MSIIRKIEDGSIDLEKLKEKQAIFRLNLREAIRQKCEHKSKEQKSTVNNLKTVLQSKWTVW